MPAQRFSVFEPALAPRGPSYLSSYLSGEGYYGGLGLYQPGLGDAVGIPGISRAPEDTTNRAYWRGMPGGPNLAGLGDLPDFLPNVLPGVNVIAKYGIAAVVGYWLWKKYFR